MTPPDQINPPPEGGWESLKVDELKAELEARGLPKSGKKDELIARLADDDVAQAGTAPETAAEEAAPDVSEEEPAEEEPADEEPAEDEPAETEALRGGPGEAAAPPRGSAETVAQPQDALTPPRRVRDRARRARYCHSLRASRLVLDHIRGKRVEQAQAILQQPRPLRLHRHPQASELSRGERQSAYDSRRGASPFIAPSWRGPTIKRFRPRALGRARPSTRHQP